MTRALLAVLVAALAVGRSAAAGVRAGASPVQKVLLLIEDFASKVKREMAESTRNFEEYAKFCDDEASELSYAMKGSKERIVELQATIDFGEAGIETETTKVSELSQQISDTERQLHEAVAVREAGNKDFKAAEAQLVDTVESLAGAQLSLKKSLALVQAGSERMQSGDRATVLAVAKSLGQIAEAAVVSTQQRDAIQAFLQEREDMEEDEGETFGARARTSDSGAILDTLQEMEDKASDSLTKIRNEEMDAASAGSLMKQGLENKITSLKKEMAQSTQKKQALVESTAEATTDIDGEKKTLHGDDDSLGDLKHECQSRAKEYEAESKDLTAELSALAKAKNILDQKFSGASFVQLRSQTHLGSATRFTDSRAQALRMIEQLGKRYQSTALVSLAFRASANPFGKVRDMIQDMIDKLLQKAAEEATQKAFCDKEMGESKAQEAAKSSKIDKISARLGKAEAQTAKLMEESSRISKELAEGDAGVAHATKIRNEEKAAFLESEKDLSESEEACASAISVLREYYEGASSFVQVSSRTRLSTAAAGETAATENDGSGIISVLEIAEADFATSLAEVRAAESASADAYEKFMADSKILKASKTMELKGKQSHLKALKMSISENSEDKAGITDELGAITAYLDKLKPQCETKEPSYAEVKAKREAEIEGLKDALQVLSGSGVPAAFLQPRA